MNRQAMLTPPRASIIKSAIIHALAFVAMGTFLTYIALGAAGWL